MSRARKARPARCRAFRRALDVHGPTAASDPRFTAHARSCAVCSALLAKLEAARTRLAAQVAEVAPPPGFAARVIAHLPRREALLGWAALRLLPVSLAIALTAGYLLARSPLPFDLPPTGGSDAELLAWLLLATGGAS